MRRQAITLAAAMAVGAVGCRDLERFDTSGDEPYCGEMVRAPFQTGFLRDGAEPPAMSMRLTFDIHDLARAPGTITTDDVAQGLCAPSPLFLEQRLRAVSEAFHDPVSMLEFGDGREKNILVWVDSACRGTFLGVLSLMQDDAVEVRLFKPAPEPNSDTPRSERPGFAEFRLEKRSGGCGF